MDGFAPSSLQIDLLDYHDDVQRRIDDNGRLTLYDPARRVYVVATPEEYVRQLLLRYMHEVLSINYGRMSIERGYQQQDKRRYDLAIYRPDGSCSLIAECKTFREPLPDDIYFQVAQYDANLLVDYILITNGKQTLIWDRRTHSFNHKPRDLIGHL